MSVYDYSWPKYNLVFPTQKWSIEKVDFIMISENWSSKVQYNFFIVNFLSVKRLLIVKSNLAKLKIKY